MGSILILLAFAYIIFSGLVTPWKGAVGYILWVTLVPTWNWRWSLAIFPYQQWIVISLLIGIAIHGFKQQRLEPRLNFARWCFLAYLLLCFASEYQSTLSSWKSERFLEITWKIALAFALLVATLDKPKKVFAAVVAFVLAQGWNAWNVNQLFYQNGINVKYFNWNYLDNNVYSISTIPVFGFTLALAYCSSNKILQLTGLTIAALQAHQIMILQSRGTMLGAILTFAVGIWCMRRTKSWIPITTISIVVGLALAGPSVAEEFSTIFVGAEERDSSAAGRVALWRAGLTITLQNPLLGVGPWCGEKLVPGLLGQPGSHKALHNLFFEVSTGMGIFGLAAYVSLFLIPYFIHLRLYMRQRRYHPEWFQICNFGVLASLPGYFLSSMFSSGALIENPYILAAISISSANVFLRLDSAEIGRNYSQIASHENNSPTASVG